jgi:hypothetical protein
VRWMMQPDKPKKPLRILAAPSAMHSRN